MITVSIKEEGSLSSCVSVPVPVLVLPLLVAGVVAAGGRRGGCFLGLQVLQSRVHVLCVLLTRLVLLVLQIRRSVALCAAACLP